MYGGLQMRNLLIIIIIMFSVKTVYASDSQTSSIINKQLQVFDFHDINSTIQKIPNQYVEHFNFKDMIAKVISGEMKFEPNEIVDFTWRKILNEIYLQSNLIKNLIIISILCAILKNLSNSFMKKSVGELSFYVCYIVLVIILFSSFVLSVQLTKDAIQIISDIMLAFLPLQTALVISSGNFASAYAFNPIVSFAAEFISIFIKDMLLPITVLCASMQIINFLSEREFLNQFSVLAKNGISFVLKGMAILFMVSLSLQSIAAPILNNVLNRTAKIAVSTIPVVGEVFVGAVDTVQVWSKAVRSGAIVASIILIIVVCSFPVLKLAVLVLIYKFTAAIIQPISDERIVKCINAIGSFTFVLLGTLTTVSVMFIFSVMITLTAVT